MVLDFEQLKPILAQRFPFQMLDRVLVLEKGKRIVAIKNVTGNEIHFLGHFPSKAVMPGALIIETLAQAASVLYELSQDLSMEKESEKFLGSVKMKFLIPVIPGDQLVAEIKVIKLGKRSFLVAGAVATVGQEVVAKGEIVIIEKEVATAAKAQ